MTPSLPLTVLPRNQGGCISMSTSEKRLSAAFRSPSGKKPVTPGVELLCRCSAAALPLLCRCSAAALPLLCRCSAAALPLLCRCSDSTRGRPCAAKRGRPHDWVLDQGISASLQDLQIDRDSITFPATVEPCNLILLITCYWCTNTILSRRTEELSL
jgi:hypothetical protein